MAASAPPSKAQEDLATSLVKALGTVMDAQQNTTVEGLEGIAEALHARESPPSDSGRPGKLNSTIKVEPQKNPQDAEEFVRGFESICKMASNAGGINAS